MRHCGVEKKFVKVCEGLFSEVETRVAMVSGKVVLCLHFCLIFI